MAKKTSKSKAVAQKTIYATFKILKENDGELSGREVIEKLHEFGIKKKKIIVKPDYYF